MSNYSFWLLAFLWSMSKSENQRPAWRKSPRQARSTETVSVILEAAARILESDGLAGFNTNAVAARAGVSIGSLYQYYPNKEALIGALLARETALAVGEAEVSFSARTGVEALSRLIEAAVAHQLRRPALARILDFEEARMPFDKDTLQVRDRIRSIIFAALERSDMPHQDNPWEAASDLLAIIRGMVDAAGERGEVDQAALRCRVGRAVFGYLGLAAALPGASLAVR
jgi:AcrR family transcriptional regulator